MAVSTNPFFNGEFAKFDFASLMDPTKLAEQWEKMDFTALPEQFKVPGVDAQALVQAQKKNIEAVASANKIALEGAQAVIRRQSEILRQGIEEASKAFGELNAAGTPQDKLTKQAELMKQAYEASLSNLRELTEMASKSNGEAAELLTTRVSESFSEFSGEVAKTAKKK